MKQVVCKAISKSLENTIIGSFLHLEKLVVFALVSWYPTWSLLLPPAGTFCATSEDKSSCGVVARCAKTAESCNSQWHHQITSGWSLANQ